MKTIAVIITAALLSLVGISTAQAGTPNCVTRGEFSRVHLGDTRAHVRRVFDVAGHRVIVQPQGDAMTRFPACSGGSVFVEFERELGVKVVEQKLARF